MSNEFDIEKAKAGEPVEFLTGDTKRWVPVHFVGTDEIGRAVVQRLGNGPIFCPQNENCHIRMAPKTVKVRYRNYKMCDSVSPGVSMICDRPGWRTPEEIEKKSWFRGWIHNEWQAVEIEQ